MVKNRQKALFFSTIFAVAQAVADPLPSCPPMLEVSQSALHPPAPWNPLDYQGRHRFIHLTFKLAGDAGAMRPDEEQESEGKRTMIWDVSGLKNLQQVCEYGGTLATLTRTVQGRRTRCEVVERFREAGERPNFG